MRDRDLPAMRDYLAAERAHYDQQLDAGLHEELAAELIARVAPAEDSVSWRRDGHTYFTRTVPGKEFEQFCRAGSGGTDVLLDVNLLLDDPACSGGYVELGVREVSPDGRLLAYSVDFDGGEIYQLRVRDLVSGADLADRIDGTYYELAWAADSRDHNAGSGHPAHYQRVGRVG
jgi:oligopeptidase B